MIEQRFVSLAMARAHGDVARGRRHAGHRGGDTVASPRARRRRRGRSRRPSRRLSIDHVDQPSLWPGRHDELRSRADPVRRLGPAPRPAAGAAASRSCASCRPAAAPPLARSSARLAAAERPAPAGRRHRPPAAGAVRRRRPARTAPAALQRRRDAVRRRGAPRRRRHAGAGAGAGGPAAADRARACRSTARRCSASLGALVQRISEASSHRHADRRRGAGPARHRRLRPGDGLPLRP